MLPFDYVRANTVAEALEALGGDGETAVLAGGTDLVLRLKRGQRTPRLVVDIKPIEALGALTVTEGGLSLGAGVTMARVGRHPELPAACGALREGAGLVGSQQIRNRATVVGNVCNATPCADTVPALLALGAAARIARAGAERRVPLAAFFVGPRQTVLEPGELVLSVEVPPAPPGSGSAYARHTTRMAMDLAVAGVAAWVQLEADGRTCRDAAIALGAVAPTPLRAHAAEERLRGHELLPELVAEAAAAAAAASQPITDVRGSADFRRRITGVLTRRTVAAAAAAASRQLARSQERP